MPERFGYLYDELTSWENLLIALKKSAKRKKAKDETAEWLFYQEERILELRQALIEKTYKPDPYSYFIIREPKERIISVASFRDRVVHHALVNVIEPFFEKIFISDSYATRKDKGLHRAVKKAQFCSRKNKWYLKLDIKKYFESIDHGILLSLINRKIKDPDIIWLCEKILQNQVESASLKADKGIPVGNLSSQFFANVYLNRLDHFIKEDLKYKFYVRYMDDMIIFSDNRSKLKRDLQRIEKFLNYNLLLRIKEKSVQINRTSGGLPFLGYRIFPGMLRVSSVNLKRCLKGLKRQEQSYIEGKIDAEKLYQSTQSRLGFIGYANTSRLFLSLWGRNQQAVPTG